MGEKKLLRDVAWFWGELSRRDEQELLRNKPDGTFLVRYSSTAGDYTISLKHNSTNKLIKINHKHGRYGFAADDTPFASVVELVDFYSHHSLQQFNTDLDVMLLHPCKSDSESEAKSVEELERYLETVQEEHSRNSIEYDRLTNLISFFTHKLQCVQSKEKAVKLTLAMYENQVAVGNENLKEAKAHEKNTLHSNFAICRTKCDETRVRLKNVQQDLDSCVVQLHELDRLFIAMNADLAYWERRRQSVERALQWRRQRQCAPALAESPAPPAVYIARGNSQCEHWLMKPTASKQEAISLLSKPGVKDGTFLVRPSATCPGFYALSIVLTGAIQNVLIEHRQTPAPPSDIECDENRTPTSRYGLHGANKYFDSLDSLVRYYAHNSLQSHNQGLDVALLHPALMTSSDDAAPHGKAGAAPADKV